MKAPSPYSPYKYLVTSNTGGLVVLWKRVSRFSNKFSPFRSSEKCVYSTDRWSTDPINPWYYGSYDYNKTYKANNTYRLGGIIHSSYCEEYYFSNDLNELIAKYFDKFLQT